jgi:hypothetical protein
MALLSFTDIFNVQKNWLISITVKITDTNLTAFKAQSENQMLFHALIVYPNNSETLGIPLPSAESQIEITSGTKSSEILELQRKNLATQSALKKNIESIAEKVDQINSSAKDLNKSAESIIQRVETSVDAMSDSEKQTFKDDRDQNTQVFDATLAQIDSLKKLAVTAQANVASILQNNSDTLAKMLAFKTEIVSRITANALTNPFITEVSVPVTVTDLITGIHEQFVKKLSVFFTNNITITSVGITLIETQNATFNNHTLSKPIEIPTYYYKMRVNEVGTAATGCYLMNGELTLKLGLKGVTASEKPVRIPSPFISINAHNRYASQDVVTRLALPIKNFPCDSAVNIPTDFLIQPFKINDNVSLMPVYKNKFEYFEAKNCTLDKYSSKKNAKSFVSLQDQVVKNAGTSATALITIEMFD